MFRLVSCWRRQYRSPQHQCSWLSLSFSNFQSMIENIRCVSCQLSLSVGGHISLHEMYCKLFGCSGDRHLQVIVSSAPSAAIAQQCTAGELEFGYEHLLLTQHTTGCAHCEQETTRGNHPLPKMSTAQHVPTNKLCLQKNSTHTPRKHFKKNLSRLCVCTPANKITCSSLVLCHKRSLFL